MTFGFTYFTYNIQRLIKFRSKLANQSNLGYRLQWVIKHLKPLVVTSLIFGALGIICAYFLNEFCWYLLVPMGFLTVFYVIPLTPFSGKGTTLRQLPFLKIFVIAFVWSIVIIVIPFTEISVDINLFSVLQKIPWLSFSAVFCFVVAITIPFDIRDMEFDRKDQIQTIPTSLGLKKSVLISVLFALCSFLCWLFIGEIKNHILPLGLGYLITILLILATNEKRNEFFYAGWIESTVLIVYGTVLIAQYCFSL
jgi:4-hydroxybenzoate polyprenyltransferase